MVRDRQLTGFDKWKGVIRLTLLTLGLGGVVLFLVSLAPSLLSTNAIDLTEVTIASAEYRTLDSYIPIRAKIRPGRRVELEANVVGRVEKVHCRSGDVVTTGMVLVELSNPALQLEVAGRESEIYQQWIASISTKHQLLQSKSNLDRQEILTLMDIANLTATLTRLRAVQPKGGATIEDIEKVERSLDAKKQIVDSLAKQALAEDEVRDEYFDKTLDSIRNLQAALELARRSLESLTVRSPINGRISVLEVENGVLLNIGDPLATIDDMSSITLEAEVDEYYAGQIEVGAVGEVLMENNTPLRTTVSYIVPSVIDGSFEIQLSITDDLEDMHFFVGQTVSIRLARDPATGVLTLPVGEYLDSTSGRWLYVVDEARSKASRREVRLGRRSAEFLEVLDGVTEGERVITSSYRGLSSDTIRLQ